MDLDWTGSFQLNPFHTLHTTQQLVRIRLDNSLVCVYISVGAVCSSDVVHPAPLQAEMAGRHCM